MVIEFLTLAGFATFFINRGIFNLWLLLPFVFFLFTCLNFPKNSKALHLRHCFFPFAAGLFIWPMRLFYWDRFDFSNRVQNLLLLAGVFSLWLIFRQQRWGQKIRWRFNSLALKKRALAIFIVLELLFITASGIITCKGVALVGDEPHYLAISQSITRDGDLNVFNQYYRDGFKEFLRVEKLPAHGTFGKGFKTIYSYHLPGLSLTLAPFFLFKLPITWFYFLIRSYLGIFGALLAVVVYLFCLKIWRRRDLAFHAVLAFALTVPVFFYSFHIFPEIQALLLILSALYLLLFFRSPGNLRFLFAGLLLGSTIFWGVKYALFIYPLSIGFFVHGLWKKNYRSALLPIIFPLLFQALFFYYLHTAYGSFSPDAVYYGMLSPEQKTVFYNAFLRQITLPMRLETLLDYFFDQRDGLLLYNPLYFFAFPGLLLALKKIKRYRWHLLMALPAALFILNHAFSTIRSGYCPQGRYLTPVTWIMLMLIMIYFRESRNLLFKKALPVLTLYSTFVVLYQTLQPQTLYQPTTHDTLLRPGLLFQNWSNIYIKLPNLLPSFIKTDNSGYVPNYLFAALFLLLLFLALLRLRSVSIRGGKTALFLAIFALCSLFPRPDLFSPRPLPDNDSHFGRIYFNPKSEGQKDLQSLIFSSRDRCGMIIESWLPLREIELTLNNLSAQSTLNLGIAEFDRALPQRELSPSESIRIQLRQPLFKKIKKRFFYQLHLQGKTSAGDEIPSWLLSVHIR